MVGFLKESSTCRFHRCSPVHLRPNLGKYLLIHIFVVYLMTLCNSSKPSVCIHQTTYYYIPELILTMMWACHVQCVQYNNRVYLQQHRMWVASLQCASVDLRPAGWSAEGDSIQQPHHALPLPKGSPSSIKGSNLLKELYTGLFNKLKANYNITGKTTTLDAILHSPKWLHPMAITVSCM